MSGKSSIRYRPDVVTGLSLLALVVASLGLAYVPMGWGNVAVALGIAALQAVIVAAVFMELRKPKTLMRLSAAAALVFLAILFVLSFADYLSRPLQIEGGGPPAQVEGSGSPGG